MLRHALLACGVETPVARRNTIQVTGKVVEHLAHDLFSVRLDDGRRIRAHVSGGMRTRIVRLLPGDRVEVEITERDLDRGRIVERLPA